MQKVIMILLPSRADLPSLAACEQPTGLPVCIEQGADVYALNLISSFSMIHDAVKAIMPEAIVSELTRLSWGDASCY